MTTTPETRVVYDDVREMLIRTMGCAVSKLADGDLLLELADDFLTTANFVMSAAPAAPAPEPVAKQATWRAFKSAISPRIWGIEADDPTAVAAGLEVVVAPCMPEHAAKSIAEAWNRCLGPASVTARAADEAEQFIQAAIDSAPEPLRRLGEWLANKLDDDDWKTADRLVTGAAVALARATPLSPNPVADNPAGDPVVNAPMSLWAEAAKSMLATYDAFMDGALQSPADRASFEHLLLAASFGAQAFDDAPPIARGGAEVSLLLKAFCQALIDPSDKRLDHLRANYAPPPAAEGSR